MSILLFFDMLYRHGIFRDMSKSLNFYSSHLNYFTVNFHATCVLVPKSIRTCAVFLLCNWRVHAAQSVFWCHKEVGVSTSRSCETLHETILKGLHLLCVLVKIGLLIERVIPYYLRWRFLIWMNTTWIGACSVFYSMSWQIGCLKINQSKSLLGNDYPKLNMINLVVYNYFNVIHSLRIWLKMMLCLIVHEYKCCLTYKD